MAETSPAFDLEQVLNNLGHDMELFREVATLFLEDSQQQLDALRAALQQNDAAQARLVAHSLKGAVSNFGAQEAYELARQLEEAARQGDLGRAKDLYEKLTSSITVVYEAVRDVLKEAS